MVGKALQVATAGKQTIMLLLVGSEAHRVLYYKILLELSNLVYLDSFSAFY